MSETTTPPVTAFAKGHEAMWQLAQNHTVRQEVEQIIATRRAKEAKLVADLEFCRGGTEVFVERASEVEVMPEQQCIPDDELWLMISEGHEGHVFTADWDYPEDSPPIMIQRWCPGVSYERISKAKDERYETHD